MTLTEFLLARIAEDADAALKRMHHAQQNYLLLQDPKYLGRLIPGWYEWPEIEADAAVRLVECEAKRQIIEWHKAWPVLVEGPPPTLSAEPFDDISSATLRMTRQIVWATEQEYRDRFGSEPPTGPVLRFLALPYADHPDYRQAWRP